jgi:hypothetical protein
MGFLLLAVTNVTLSRLYCWHDTLKAVKETAETAQRNGVYCVQLAIFQINSPEHDLFIVRMIPQIHIRQIREKNQPGPVRRLMGKPVLILVIGDLGLS